MKYRQNAGYTIIETHTNRLSDRWEGYVLGENPKTGMYVTWYYLDRNGETVYNLGHYFNTKKEALADFYHRVSCIYA